MNQANEPITDAKLAELRCLHELADVEYVEANDAWKLAQDRIDFLSAVRRDLPAIVTRIDLAEKEVDRLRVDLKGAYAHSEYQSKEICQWADALYIGTWPLSQEDTGRTGFYGRLAAKMTKERNSAVERAEKAEKELSEVKEFLAKLGDAVFESAERGNSTLRLTEAQLNNASRNAKYYADKCVCLENQLDKLRELIEDWKDNGEFDWSHPREAAIANYLTEVPNA